MNTITTAPYGVTFQSPATGDFWTLTVVGALPTDDPMRAAELAAKVQGYPLRWVHSVSELSYDDIEGL